MSEVKSTKLESFIVQKFEYIEELQILLLCCFDTYFDETVNDST